jgi:hypothetical protein
MVYDSRSPMTYTPGMPPPDQILMGTGIAIVCLVGAGQSEWLIANTRKGRRLGEWLGDARALWGLRAALVCGAIAGALLALGVLNPLRW